MATALLLLELLSAFSLQVLILFWIACSCLSIKCSGLPSLNPLAFFACRADFVLAAISSASYCEIADRICNTILLACGKSQNTISTSFSRRFDRKETFLANLSNLATISVASVFLQRLNASLSLGLSFFRPDSISTNSATGILSRRYFCIISLCASSPSPEYPCFCVLARR